MLRSKQFDGGSDAAELVHICAAAESKARLPMADLINPIRMRRVAAQGETLVQEFFINPPGWIARRVHRRGSDIHGQAEVGPRQRLREDLTDDELSQLPPALREKLKREGFRPLVEFGRVGPGHSTASEQRGISSEERSNVSFPLRSPRAPYSEPCRLTESVRLSPFLSRSPSARFRSNS